MGINFTTYLNQLGYGVVGLNLAKALERGGHEPALWAVGAAEVPAEDRADLATAFARARRYDPEAPSLRRCHQHDMAHRAGRGLPVFELNRLTAAEKHHLGHLDVVLAPSRWAAGVLEEQGIAGRVHVTPFGVDRTIFHEAVAPRLAVPEAWRLRFLDGPAPTIFLAAGKWEVRKGHDVLIQAFRDAFVPADNVLLVLHCTNPFLSASQTEEWERFALAGPLGPRTRVLQGRFRSQKELAHPMAAADCGVFPARAEGWRWASRSSPRTTWPTPSSA